MRAHFVVALLSVVVVEAAIAQVDPGPNWLNNPGAEVQPVTASGWRQVSGNWGTTKPGTAARSGNHFFWSGQSASGELVQEIPLAALSAQLSAGTAVAALTGWINTWEGDADSGAMTIEAVAANGSVLRSETTGQRNVDRWTEHTLRLTLPAAAATVRVKLAARRVAGNDNNGYFDDLTLHLTDATGRSLMNPASAQTTAQSLATPPLPTVPPDRPGAVTALTTYYGLLDLDAELTTTDAIVNRTYADTYSYEALAGESMWVEAFFQPTPEYHRTGGATWATEVVPNLAIILPSGAPVAVQQRRESGNATFTVPRGGTVTIRVSADDPANLGRYRLSVRGRGTRFEGAIDPFNDRRDLGVIYDSVELDITAPGIYQFELIEKLRDGGLVVRNDSYRAVHASQDVIVTDFGRVLQVLLSPGRHHVIIEDRATGGPWELLVLYTGPPGR